MSDDLQDLSSELVVLSARLVRAVRRAVEQPAGFRVLSLLDELGPSGVSSLAVADRCSQPTMSGTVAGLVERGWVTRTPHPSDARSSLIDLTVAGRHELARVRRIYGAAVAERLRDQTTHTREDVETAVAVLRDVLASQPTKGQL
ncbi:MarR family winged helix-turn-helix transcriptional regulator [Nocardioides sp. LHG3406-4]|uniref:MarR family winged helix-turn-helix transcriptional regulator n=1 Tax=Nocardioides sp. LHG3406-4 TaxID=2804575 RepID=UPI003CF93837